MLMLVNNKERKKTIVTYSTCLIVLFLDQLSKYFVRCFIQSGEGIWVIRDIFSICYIKNPGIAFGLLVNFSEIFIYVNIILVGIIIFIYQKIKKRTNHQIITSLIFGLIIGGAVGNIIDRILFKGVIDFLDIGWKEIRWPAFNLADMSICIGMFLLCFFIFREGKGKRIS